jgi:sugar fermentation stimulation protein A
MTEIIYSYPNLLKGTLLKRYKRFLADIQLETGEVITAHCANTGPMIGVCSPGSRVQVSRSDNPNRKLPYSWEMIEVGETWVGINTSLPNRVVKIALEKRLFPELIYDRLRPEVTYGKDKKSRIDFLLTNNQGKPPIYLEVKSTTLAEGNLALFPDTVTTRGQKHLEELMALIPDAQPVMLYFINRSDCTHFAPGTKYDRTYSDLFSQALEKGVKILPCRFAVTPQGISYLGLAELLRDS